MGSAPQRSDHDAVVIGGGPAGSATATFLQRQGYDCLILERSAFPRYHIGESLIPHTYGTLDRLGLLPKLRASRFPEKHSVRFVLGTEEESHPFYFSETIPGEAARTWQVERAEFDRMCLDHARVHGAEARMETRVDAVHFDDGRAVGVRAHPRQGGAYDVTARVLVDASGRSTVIGSQLGLTEEVPGLRKASVWGYYKGGRRLEGVDAGETTIFLLPNRGWVWYIPLPDDIVSVGVVADPEELFHATTDAKQILTRVVASCEPLSERLRHAEPVGQVRGLPRLAYRNRRAVGDGWLMIGDAAAFLDPIYSSGLFLALGSAELASASVADALAADDVSAARLGAFRAPLMEGVEVVRHLIHAFYDPSFSFRQFLERHPEQRKALIDCLVGDVIGKDMRPFLAALAELTPPPRPLDAPESEAGRA